MNILTFDLEDWFHILDFEETAHPEQWEKFESRIERNTDRILSLLDEHHLTATFFCLGWIAEKYPALIKKVSARHEVACHSMNHQLLYLQSQEQFKTDLRKSIDVLENVSGKKVTAYRAPGFSLQREHGYVLEELNRVGVTIDCSVFPAQRNHGGIAGFPEQRPCVLTGSNFSVIEFPINTRSFLNRQIVFSGGGYFRLLPYPLIRKWMNESEYVMTYFHPRDFDPGQPRLDKLPMKRKFMSYTGLNSSLQKFRQLLSDFEFVSLGRACEILDKESLPVVKL